MIFLALTLMSISPERRDALLEALAAVRAKGNKMLEASIIAALEDRPFDMSSHLPSIHPEVDHLFKH